ncbi:MipA/OmpV family protein [Idiomarina xiamenensis]|uniref:MltA-interacting MipA family protein n=1 Tax=Idiomarina xiamenensis 10-D-4 TaxID=740709 RepID=K2KPA7_9GAMM|nr:MipA/OmpV family protein [Idiomarina xiamenensis]EKE84194.1 MltA-interacting MipA family protein [Idiomarina xiamenensis 10-D-4]
MTLRCSVSRLTIPAMMTFLMLSPAQAQQDDSQETQWGLGVGAGIKQKEYQGDDSQSRIIPVLYAENRWLRLIGPNLDIKLASFADVSFNVRAKFALGDGYEAEDSWLLTGMAERKASIWLGPQATWQTAIGDFSAELLTDTMSHSEGLQASLSYGKTFAMNQHWSIEPKLKLTWLNDDYVDYYYGVSAAEATPERAFYTADASLNYSAEVAFHYQLDRRHRFSFAASYTQLGSDIKDSPIVDQSGLGQVAFIYLYRF